MYKYKIMKTQNKVQLVGYLGRDPDIKVFEKGTKKARMRLATDTYYKKNPEEDAIKKTIWHTIVCWNEVADIVENNFIKGSHIMVEGMIEYRVYSDKDGVVKDVTEIKAFHLTDLDR